MRKDGGLAFPRPSNKEIKELQDGMTLLDWFAGQAMNGVLSNSSYQEQDILNDELSQWAYRMAFAMLRSKENFK